jgi:hypothetical protein
MMVESITMKLAEDRERTTKGNVTATDAKA